MHAQLLLGANSAGSGQVFLTSGTSWAVPSNFDPFRNKIECIGGGGGGSNAATTNSNGGGGGAYSRTNNLLAFPAATLTVQIGAAGTVGGSGTDTWISTTGSAPTSVSEGCLAKAGLAGGTGGPTATGIGHTKNAGGAGGVTGLLTGGGGGGAAGPLGAGGAGGGSASFGGGGGGGKWRRRKR